MTSIFSQIVIGSHIEDLTADHLGVFAHPCSGGGIPNKDRSSSSTSDEGSGYSSSSEKSSPSSPPTLKPHCSKQQKITPIGVSSSRKKHTCSQNMMKDLRNNNHPHPQGIH
jgi:hypothetical protein